MIAQQLELELDKKEKNKTLRETIRDNLDLNSLSEDLIFDIT